jgi:DNA (cytosine-5)-methyltransferase 1
MYELALFAGGGGGLLGSLLLGWRTVCYVERDAYCRKIIQARIRDGILHDAPIWDDVRSFDGKPWRGCVDIVTAGFPCQPFSAAGKQLGEDDERNCWPYTARILGEVRPRYALLENVPAIISSGYFGRVLGDLAALGFDCRWGVFSAAGVGASHRRKRLWIRCELADTQSDRRFARRASYSTQSKKRREPDRSGDETEVADTNHQGLAQRQSQSGDNGAECQAAERGSWWSVEPDVGRVANGVASRVDRLRAIGNGQVPAVVVKAWSELCAKR